MPQNNKDDWLRTWLREWAEWYSRETGWSSTTVEYRLKTLGAWSRGTKPGLPNGVVPPGQFNRLIAAMQLVSEQGGRPAHLVAVMRAYYLAGGGAKAGRELGELLQRKYRTVREQKEQGERLIKEHLRGCG